MTDTPTRTATEVAVSLLSRREHSVLELRQKLGQRGYSSDDIAHALQRMQDTGLQSDQRYAEVFVRSRARRRYGPVKIAAELRQRGVDASIVEQTIGESEMDWRQLAAEQACRKSPSPPASLADKAKLQRSLAARGFTADQVRYAVDELTAKR